MADIHNQSDDGEQADAPFARLGGRTVMVRRLRVRELEGVFALTRANLAAEVAPLQIAERVLRHNPDSIWGIFRIDGKEEQLAGFCSLLHLNPAGLAALESGVLHAHDPDLALLETAGVQPAAIYIWALVARGLGAVAIPLITEALGPAYVGAPLFATAGTEQGLRTLEGFGYEPAVAGARGVGALYRQGKQGKSRTEDGRRTHRLVSRCKVEIALDPAQVDMALAIRAAVFLAEQNCPYAEEFDGNDRTATHVVGFIEGEPAATMRIRYFADFVKLERLAVLPRFRRTLIAKEVIHAAINFCRRKGYRKIYGYAQKRLVPFWKRFGLKPLDVNRPLVFSDHEYVVMWGEFDAHADPITMHTDPFTVLRPEGKWDAPGPLDPSRERPPTNPH